MEQLILEDNIVLMERVDDWKEAIVSSAKPLIEGGYIEPRYVDAIFESTKKNGPYYVLAPEIAMPHAGVNDGVRKQQISLLVLKHPVKFSEDGFDVRLIFTLAAVDNQSHLNILKQLSEIFVNEVLIQEIIKSTSARDIVCLMNNLGKNNKED